MHLPRNVPRKYRQRLRCTSLELLLTLFILAFTGFIFVMHTRLNTTSPSSSSSSPSHLSATARTTIATAAGAVPSSLSKLHPSHLKSVHSPGAKDSVADLRNTFTPFDPPRCPPTPPPGYPREYPVMDIIKNWNPDLPNYRPEKIYQSLCYFDYGTDLAAAYAYREAEVPFIVRGVPDVDDTVLRWSDPLYMRKMLKGKSYKVEESENNHFMYWTGKKKKLRGWVEPTKNVKMTFEDWLSRANAIRDSGGKHYYFRASGCSSRGGCPPPNLR